VKAATRLFVYGTLKPGCRNHGVLLAAGAVFLGGGETAPGFALFLAEGRLPALVAGGEGRVRGEVWEVGPEGLAALDRFEGPHRYRRAVIPLADGEAAAYLWDGPHEGLVPLGSEWVEP
jgi:gamma-glutamylcyclotransferase (GGCT)/AIG2-like uncharacterized protein YtfP